MSQGNSFQAPERRPRFSLLRPLAGIALLGIALFPAAFIGGAEPPAGASAPLPAEAASGVPIAPGAKLQRLAGGFAFTEGPAADASGNVYFTDQPKDRIWIWTTDGKLKLFRDKTGRANGLYFDNAGALLACSDENNELWRFDVKTGTHEVLTGGFDGKNFNGPNDLWIHPNGGIYFTDPLYERDYWKSRHPLRKDGEQVYYLLPGEKVCRVATAAIRFKKPNGIIGSPDGKRLYVSDIGAGKIYVHELAPDGSLLSQRLFAKAVADGMTLDSEENLYLAGKKGVTVFNRNGVLLGVIAVKEPWTANVCFGGKDGKTLFITASGALYSIEMKTTRNTPGR